jgi:predicted ATP-dependent endonuclease of OLD family
MINALNIKKFTEFSEAQFEFSDGLNALISFIRCTNLIR